MGKYPLVLELNGNRQRGPKTRLASRKLVRWQPELVIVACLNGHIYEKKKRPEYTKNEQHT